MSAILSIDTLAQRYSVLPSELLDRATTFDLYICNSALRYQQIRQNEAEGKYDHYSEEDLLKIKEQAL
jgi:hypothetical protein